MREEFKFIDLFEEEIADLPTNDYKYVAIEVSKTVSVDICCKVPTNYTLDDIKKLKERIVFETRVFDEHDWGSPTHEIFGYFLKED